MEGGAAFDYPTGLPVADAGGAGGGAAAGGEADAGAPAAPLPKEVAQPLSLLAFNKFATERRKAMKDGTEPRVATEVERHIGTLWRALPQPEKDVYVNAAREEREHVIATQFGGVEPPRPARKRHLKTEAEAGEGGEEGAGGEGAADGSAGAAAPPAAPPKPPGKKRGRPPKTAYMAGAGAFPALPPDAAAFAAAMGAPAGPAAPPAPAPAAPASLVGARVEGVVDGAFDVGYFLTLMRAIVFRPELCGGQQVAAAAPPAPEDAGAAM